MNTLIFTAIYHHHCGITAAEAHAAAQRLLAADPSLAHLGPLLTPEAFVDNGYIGLGVPMMMMQKQKIALIKPYTPPLGTSLELTLLSSTL